jgi:hypothetical protein
VQHDVQGEQHNGGDREAEVDFAEAVPSEAE